MKQPELHKMTRTLNKSTEATRSTGHFDITEKLQINLLAIP